MSTVKAKETVLVVNPKDPSDPDPHTANRADQLNKGWTLWADRFGPEHMAQVAAQQEAGEAVVTDDKGDNPKPVVEDPPKVVEDPKPVVEDPPKVEVDPKGSAVDLTGGEDDGKGDDLEGEDDGKGDDLEGEDPAKKDGSAVDPSEIQKAPGSK